MHDEWRVARERFVAPFVGIGLRVGPFLFRKVRHVVAGPIALRFIPPDQFLALTPRRSVRRGGGTVVENAAIHRPRVAPAVTVLPARVAAVRFVLAVEDAGVNPAAARGAAVVFQFAETLDWTRIGAAMN